uniref:Uncharacterized protein n=1 Tax=Opuntia streptacantha TaxID=393608 RepID=A0A7C8YDN4_OPUST
MCPASSMSSSLDQSPLRMLTRASTMTAYQPGGQPADHGFYISPHSEMTHASLGRLFGPVATFSIFLTTKRPSPSTLPNTTCLLSSHSHFAQVIKNWHPFVFGPLFAIDNKPGPVCLAMKFSSSNFVP